MKTFVFTIEKSRYEHFIETVEKMKRRAFKLGLPEITLVEGEEFLKRIGDHASVYRFKTCAMQNMTIIAPDLKIDDDWSLIGSIECGSTKFEGMTLNLVTSFTDDENLGEFSVGEHTCSHCRKNMMRNKLFVIKNNNSGERNLVGSSCVKDFTGHDIQGVLFYAGLTTESFYIPPDEEKFDNSLRMDFVIQQTLGGIINQKGFYYSKKSVKEGKRDSCTFDLVTHNIVLTLSPKNEYIDPPYDWESDSIKADTLQILGEMNVLIEKMLTLDDFERNIAILRNNNAVPEKFISHVVGYVGSWWTRNKGPIKDPSDIFYYDPKKSEYLGAVGDKIEILIAVEKVTESNSSFGGYLIFGHQMLTNNRFMLYSSKVNELFTHDFDKGRIEWKDRHIFKIRATVKSVSDHETYGKSTMLSRGKVLPIQLP